MKRYVIYLEKIQGHIVGKIRLIINKESLLVMRRISLF